MCFRAKLTSLSRALLDELNRENFEGCTVQEIIFQMSAIADEIPEEQEKKAEPVRVQDGSAVSRSGHGSTTRSCPEFSIPV